MRIKRVIPLDDSYIRSHKELSNVWDQYMALRREKYWAYGNDYINCWNKKFAKAGAARSVIAITLSLQEGWSGIFFERSFYEELDRGKAGRKSAGK